MQRVSAEAWVRGEGFGLQGLKVRADPRGDFLIQNSEMLPDAGRGHQEERGASPPRRCLGVTWASSEWGAESSSVSRQTEGVRIWRWRSSTCPLQSGEAALPSG